MRMADAFRRCCPGIGSRLPVGAKLIAARRENTFQSVVQQSTQSRSITAVVVLY